MDDKRASTLEALDSFIRTQRLLLEQTQEDIAKLRKLQSYALAKPNVDSDDLIHQMDEIGEIKDPLHYRLVIPNEIDWDVFNGCDPAPFHTLTLSMQEKHVSSTKPSSTQTSPLSDLQQMVKNSKKSIIDPVLERCAAYTAQLSLDDENGEEDGSGDKHHKEYWRIEMERERERQKIRELKKRKLHGGLSLPGMGVAGVHVRKDVEDESGVVDVTFGGGGDEEVEKIESAPTEDTQFDADHGSSFNGYPPLMDTDAAQVKSRPARTHKATTKRQQLQEEENSSSSKKRKRKAGPPFRSTTTPTTPSTPQPPPKSITAADPGSPMNIDKDENEDEDDDETENEPLTPTTNGKSKSARGRAGTSSSNRPPKLKLAKPKSETYKQAWSESEQNLLEQLLEKIPDGEKNRWQKISRAMNGKRTPRQVASRVQKYFEKLKKYGIDVAKGTWTRAS